VPRPLICRRVGGCPRAEYFKPAGVPLSGLEEVLLGRDEFESLRLADLEGMYQADAADMMGVSRQTFGNIVESARRKLADALVNGRALRIQGDLAPTGARTFACSGCGHEWAPVPGAGRPRTCPHCRSRRVSRKPVLGPGTGHGGRTCHKNGGVS
jgi:predicted DNA-binding protein (UPF0251 family)/DNA-directed RNA polymerase subunit RPC12/RpoP